MMSAAAEISKIEDPVVAVIDEMKGIRDETFKTDDTCPGLSQIIDSNFKAVFNEVTNALEQTLKDGKKVKIEKLIEDVKGYSSVASCFVLNKTFACHVLDLYNKVNKKEHGDRLNRIKARLDKVDALLNVNKDKVKELGEFLEKLLRLDSYSSDSSDSTLFGLKFGLIVVDLDSCTSDLMKAKEELKEGFASIRRYLTQRIVSTTSYGLNGIAVPVAIIMRFAGPLVRMIGVCCTVGGAIAVAAGALAYMGYTLYQEITFAKDVRAQYKSLESRRETLESTLKTLREKMEVAGNTKKLMDAKNKIGELEYENWKKEEEIRRLKAKYEAPGIPEPQP